MAITSGFLKAMQSRGFQDVAEWEDTGRVALIRDFLNGYGAGSGESLNDPAHATPAVLFPEIRFYTNNSWPIIRGAAASKGFPLMLMDRYSKGIVYLLNIPENEGDLYNLPQGVLTQMKRYLMQDFPVRIELQSRVALFAVRQLDLRGGELPRCARGGDDRAQGCRPAPDQPLERPGRRARA